MKSKNVTTLTRAMNTHKNSTTSTQSTDIESQNGTNSSLSRRSGGKLRSSIRALKRASGIEAVKDLWQQTGKVQLHYYIIKHKITHFTIL